MKKILSSALLLSAIWANAEIPAGYYDLLKGKSGDALKEAVKTTAHPQEYTRIDYGTSTWGAFEKTDVREVNGMKIWWDMYSNTLVTIDGHDGLNIEHSVANSWFGGKSAKDPYADLFHLNPSNEAANNQKGDLSLGEVATVSWENGLVKTGAPKSGTAGSANKVFEPADEYKGDFARAFLYIFTVYDRENWKADQSMYSYTSSATLEPWALDMLIKWAKQDPVDSKEIKRNEEINLIQKNRNPFIDYPELIDYIWGSRRGETFTPGEPAAPIDRPADPVFTNRRLTGVNTYSGRWWGGELVGVSHEEGNLWISINKGEWQQYGPGVEISPALRHGAVMQLEAYTECEKEGYTLRSSTARLTLTGRDPDLEDYTEARWVPVNSDSDFAPFTSSYFIVRAMQNGHIMGWQGGTSSSSFQPDAGMVTMEGEDVFGLPVEAAIIKFNKNESGKYLLEVFDPLHQESKGYWNVTSSGNKNTLKSNSGTLAEVKFSEDGSSIITFEGGKQLQYNKSQPRFTNYAGTQSGIKLSRFSSFIDIPSSAIAPETENDEGCVAIDGRNIYLPQGWKLYALNGRISSPQNLEPGIYIARSPKGKAVKIMIH